MPALSFDYAYDFLDEDAATAQFRALASSSDPLFRRQAARALSLLSTTSISNWMTSMVLTLSNDPDPMVRVAVTRALSEVCQRSDVAGALATDRLKDLLRGSGVFAPLQTLQQLTAAAGHAVISQEIPDRSNLRVRPVLFWRLPAPRCNRV